MNRDTTAHFKQIIVKSDGVANDSGAVGIYSTSASTGDHAMIVKGTAGNGLQAYSASNSAFEMIATGAEPTMYTTNSSTGEAIKAELSSASNTNQVVEIVTAGTGSAIAATATTGDAITATGTTRLATSTTSDTALVVRGTGTTSTGAVIVGTSYGLRGNIHGYVTPTDTMAGGDQVASLADSTSFQGTAGSETDTTTMKIMFANNPDLVGADTTAMIAMATAYPTLFYGPSGSGNGTGSYQVKIYALDTSGTDAAIEGVKVTARDAAGGLAAFDWTDGTGKVTFALDGATYTILARKTAYLWPNKSLTVTGNIDSTDIGGYDIELADAGENNCNVYGYIFDGGDNPLFGARVEAIRVGQGVAIDTTDDKSKIIPSIPVVTYVDTTGLFQLYLRKTTEMADTTKAFYDITATYANTEIFKVKKFYIPDAAYIDIGDTLLARGH